MKQLNFTDGTFIILLDSSTGETSWYEDTPYLNAHQSNALAMPFSIICLDATKGVADGVYTKTDVNNNTWTFTVNSSHSSIAINNTIISEYNGYYSCILQCDSTNGSISWLSAFNNYTPRVTANGADIDAGNTHYKLFNSLCIDGVGVSGNFNQEASAMRFLIDNATGYYKGAGGAINLKLTGLLSSCVISYYTVSDYARIGTIYPLGIYSDIGNLSAGGSEVTGYSNSLEDYDPVTPSFDPYEDAGDSTIGGGDGTFDGSSDPVPVPSLPSIGATDTGFISLFVPSASQIRQVASYLWSNFFDLATFKKIFEDPMDCILGLSVVPVSVPTSGSAQITVGNVELSGITLPLASQQYVEVDCGTVDFTRRYFGSYLDFEPYTKMSLFVPYSGVHAVSADDIIGKVVGLKYHIDILTGSLVAFLTCGNSVLYEFNGACASNIPVNSMNYASTIENAIRIAVNIGTTVATAGAAAPATAAGEGAKLAVSGAEVGRAIALGGSTAQGALSLKPSIDRAGSLGGTTGLMGNQIPYFIITRPRMCKPKNQDVFQGYPSFIQTTLGAMKGSGFTAFENVILAGSYLTDTEKSELESILTAGVYL